MGKTSKKSIRGKVTRRVVVALLVTVIALSLVNLIYMSKQIVQEQNQELKLATLECASEIDSWLLEMKTVSVGIANSLGALESLNEKDIKAIINQTAWVYGDLYFVYVGTEEGNMYMARGVQFPAGMDVRQRDWYKQAKAAGHTVITDPYVSASRSDVVLITIATPIYFGTKLVGVVGVDADITTINSYVEGIDFKNGAYGFLVDSKNDIVAHKNEEFLPTAKSSVNVSEALPDIQSIIDTPESNIVVAKDFADVDMVYYTSRLNESKWIVGVAYPEKNILKIIDSGIRICIITALICIILAAADMTTAIKKILYPIEKINPAMDKIMQGDFSTTLDISTEEDELGMLQRKIAVMLKQLSDMIHRQKYVLGEMEKGNLVVEDIEELPGELNEIATSVNSIKDRFNDVVSDIQFSAINLQSFAMGINETSDLEEMRMVFEELSAEANILMEKTSRFITLPETSDDNT